MFQAQGIRRRGRGGGAIEDGVNGLLDCETGGRGRVGGGWREGSVGAR